jgi:hypothetical protein
MQRPNDGKVADNGTFVLNDWRFSNDFSGIFWAFRADGSVILSRSFSANLLNNGLSADGAFACCQTANASTEDGSVLAVFDLSAGKEISVFTPESGWASDYEFLPEIGTVRLLYAQDGDAFAYGLDGEFTEREKWVATRLDRGDIDIVKRVMDEAGNQPEPQLAARLLASIEAGLRRLDARDKYSLSLAWKLKGEILEVLDMPQDALSAYERALTSNPKIGVKRHAERLRKALRRDGS